MNIPQDAVEAAISALKPSLNPNALYPCIEGLHRDVANALTAALPALEQQIREQVAREIEAKAPLAYYPHESGYEKYQGMKYAAQIARGKDKP